MKESQPVESVTYSSYHRLSVCKTQETIR